MTTTGIRDVEDDSDDFLLLESAFQKAIRHRSGRSPPLASAFCRAKTATAHAGKVMAHAGKDTAYAGKWLTSAPGMANPLYTTSMYIAPFANTR